MKGYFQRLEMASENKSAYFSMEEEPNFSLRCEYRPGSNGLDESSLKALLLESFGSWAAQVNDMKPNMPGTLLLCDANNRLIALYEYGQMIESFGALSNGEPEETAAALEAQVKALFIPVEFDGPERCGWIGFLPNGSDQPSDWLRAASLSFVPHLNWQLEKRKAAKLALERQQFDAESKKRDLLYQAAEKLHSLIDVDSVLTELVVRLNILFSDVSVDLMLSQDNHSMTIPVKPLNFTRVEEDICTRSFMEGKEMVVHHADGSIREASLPLVGNQGVYGVVHMTVHTADLLLSDIQMLSTLARTAGTAFENAKLYEQSNLLVSELRLINEITKRLNQSLQLNEIFNFASTELIKIFDADFCCILQLDRTRGELVVQATNLPAMFNENFAVDYGFSGVVCMTKESLIISDYWTNPKVRSKLMETTQSRSLIASPIIVNGEVVGVVLVTHRLPNFFSYENYKLLQVLSSHIGLAIANASLHNEVQRMVITDNLTGLYERHYLDEQVNLHQKKDFCGSLIVVDIDNFKTVNDTFGHQVGDKILIQVSGIIHSCIRDTDIAARWGGEELAIYLPQVSRDQSVRIAERIRSRVVNETDPKVTVSCGISDWHWQDDKISVESLFYRSDMALYKAKNEGKNQIKIG
ncbi:sensor domain-containing diguanylate cyclase [Paenibacillus sp. MBLB4367]|uniref:sensor domain-containing diguanylate cyclase n=1 Tax=Paenibacillus sp. MBLB4367 TaxID=3384767 RepID=UPI0039081352